MVAAVRNSFSRLKRGIRRYGFWPACRRVAAASFNRAFRAKLYVWVWQHAEKLAEGASDVSIRRFSSPDDVPQKVLAELNQHESTSFTNHMREEFAEGSVLWVAAVNQQVAGYQWSRRGHLVHNWHFDMTERDILVYSTVTFPGFQGRGVARTMTLHICRREVSTGGRACTDCMAWNKPAARFIRKTGFRKVAERRRLTDHPD